MARQVSAEKKQMMLTEDIRTLVPKMAVPTIVAQLITTVYNLVDAYFVSTLGTNATAAVGVNSSLERTITLIGSLIGAGACSYIARLLGGKRDDDANRVLSTSLFSALGLACVFMLVGRMFINPMVYLLGADENCATYSIQYATYVLYAAPFMVGSFILNMCLRSEGSAMFSMIGMGFGGVLNCFLDPLFIYGGEYGPGLFGIQGLGLGVAGASMATAISKTISFFILCWPYFRHRSSVTISLRKFKLVMEDVRDVLAIGSSMTRREEISLDEARHEFADMSGTKDFDLKFLYSESGYVNGTNVIHFAAFLPDAAESHDLRVRGQWNTIDQLDRRTGVGQNRNACTKSAKNYEV